MPNKCLNVLQYSDVIMGNRDTDNHEFDITEETIIDNNYESGIYLYLSKVKLLFN